LPTGQREKRAGCGKGVKKGPTYNGWGERLTQIRTRQAVTYPGTNEKLRCRLSKKKREEIQKRSRGQSYGTKRRGESVFLVDNASSLETGSRGWGETGAKTEKKV